MIILSVSYFIDYDYNSLICEQALMMVAVCLSTVMAISQIIQSINKEKGYQRLIFLSAATAATSGKRLKC